MAARILVLVLAVALAGFAVIGLHDDDACHGAGVALFEAVAQRAPVTAPIVDEYAGACRGSHPLAVAAGNLAATGHAVQAVRLSDEAIRREPGNYEGWAALAAALRKRGLDDAAQRADRQVRRLNPRFGQGPG